MMTTVVELLIIAAVLFLSVGTRFIVSSGSLAGGYWEYGTVSIYASEIAVWLAAAVILAKAGIQFIRKIYSNSSAVLDSRVHGNDTKKVWLVLPLIIILGFLAYRGHNLGWMVHVVSALALVFVLRTYRKHLKSITSAFLASAAVQALLGLLQILTQHVWSSKWLGMAAHQSADLGASVVGTTTGRLLRAYGTLPHPNLFGAYMVVAFALALWMMRFKTSSRMHGLLMGSVALFGIGVAISFSRAAWISLVLVIIAAIVLARHRSNAEKISILGASLVAIAGLVLCFIFWRTAVIPRIFLKTDFGMSERAPLEARSISEREESVRESLRVFESHLFIGVGGGNYTRAVHDELDSKRASWGYQPVHNVILLILVELGIAGFIALFILALLYRPDFLLGFFAIIPFMFTDHFLWSLWPGLALFSLVFGLPKVESLQELDKGSNLS